ncbi:extracellular solute-binding protein [Shimia sp. R9_3]|uniref:ABC transporter substrate-binding protein n=1 Tax=Shimia sp. R9_3 TaxID=2821113 RepID=UPI001ADB778E|nr:extracellular solute-binding protein [Shimia sp. R9_3]MBO9402931.1 extracellular solute-binding protein [Shimia sp. R9_3]
MKKRILLTTVAAALAAGSATADPVKLTVWSDTARIEPFKAFEAAHDNIELDIVTVAPPDQTAKLQLAMRSGDDVPDVIFMAELQQIAQLSTRRSNYLMDLSDKVDATVVNSFLPSSLSPCETGDGRLLCLRNDLAHFITWYNKPKFDELGLAVPATWEEFEKIGEVAAQNGMIVGTGTQPTPVVNMLIAGGCEPGFLVEGSTDTINIDMANDGCVAAAGMVDRMRANGALSPHGPFEPSFVTDVKDGKLLMFNGPTWFGEHVMRPLYELDGGIVAASESLKFQDQEQPVAWSWGGGVFGGYHKSEHPDEVVQLIEWMTTDTGLQGKATTMPAHADSSAVWKDRVASDPWYAAADVYDKMEASAPYGHPSYAGYRFDIMAAFAKIDGASDDSIVDKLADYAAEIENSAKVAGYKIAN